MIEELGMTPEEFQKGWWWFKEHCWWSKNNCH
jgi:hypothetical protein